MDQADEFDKWLDDELGTPHDKQPRAALLQSIVEKKETAD